MTKSNHNKSFSGIPKNIFSVLVILFLANTLFAQEFSQADLVGFDPSKALKEVGPRGIPENDTASYLHYKKMEFVGKKKGTWHQRTANAPTTLAACNNLDFETGTFAGWTGITGSNSVGNALPIVTTSPVAGIVSGYQTIVTAATDPYGLFPEVYSGTYSAKLGDTQANFQEESLSQTFTVTAANTSFSYAYALVLQDGGHPLIDEPFFDVYMTDGFGNAITSANYFVAICDTNVIGWQTSVLDNTVHFKTWTPVNIDLTPYVGQNVTITFAAAGCDQGGHFGYAYIDCSCNAFSIGQSNLLCPGDSAILSAPSGEASYLWEPGGQTTQDITVSTPGTYSVTTISTVGDTLFSTDSVIQYPAPTANFTYSVPTCTILSFTNTSTVTTPYVITNYLWNFGDGGFSTVQNPIHNFDSLGTYNVQLIVTSSTGCRDSIKIPITVNSVSVAVTANPDSICPGQSTVLTASGTASYSWAPATGLSSTTVPNPTANPTTTTTYTVTQDSTGCISTINVFVNPLPIITITGKDSIISGTQDTLIASGATSYLWTAGSNIDTNIVAPTVTTIYTVQATNSVGCSAIDSFKVVIKITTGIAILSESSNTSLYPNPASTVMSLTFNMQGIATSATINVLDIAGKSMMETNTEISNGKTIPIDISQLSTGVYFVKITTAKTSQTIKFVKQNR